MDTLKKNYRKYGKLISESIFFAGLPEEHLNAFLAIAQVRDFRKNQSIFAEGDKGDGFYLNVDGMVKIFKLSPDGKEHILHIFGPGEPYGEVPVFSGKTFPANAESITDSRSLFFPRSAIVELLSGNPAIALNMLAVLSFRLRQFTVAVENLSLKEVPGRLAAHLLMLAMEQKQTDRVELNIPKTLLASLLGTIPETLSRILGRMAAQNLIEVQGRTIRFLDMEGLQLLAETGKTTDAEK